MVLKFIKFLIPRSRKRFGFLYTFTLTGLISYFLIFNILAVKLNFFRAYYNIDYPEYTFINVESKPLVDICNPLNQETKEIKININNEIYPKIVPLFHNKTINFSCLNSNPNRKTILLWNNFIGLPLIPFDPQEASQLLVKSNCPVTNCDFISDRSQVNKSDMILFHMRSRINEFPKYRFSNQRWVYLIYESQQHCPMCSKLDNLFNLSATYSSTSDITSVYLSDSRLKWTESNPKYNESDYLLSSKTGFAVILMSDCSDNLNRLKIVKQLRNYFPVDIYGKCSDQDLKCPDVGNCREYLANIYKFFLVFENSICSEYITEKFFNTLRYNTIPVVLGGGDYSKYAPESAFINMLDYNSIDDLAKYLNYLSINQKAYSNYFKWKKFIEYDQVERSFTHYCEMCIRLQLEEFTGIEHKIFKNHSKLFDMENSCSGFKIRSGNGKELFKLGKTSDFLKMRYLESS